MNLDKELRVALDAVKKGCLLSRAVQKGISSVAKEDRSPVTIADLGTQCVISMHLMRQLPGETLVGEEDTKIFEGREELKSQVLDLVRRFESGADEKQMLEAIRFGSQPVVPERFWVLDPIDGTKGFLRGEQYATALGLIVDGKVVLGVLGCPNFGENIFYAMKGRGAFAMPLNGGTAKQIRVDRISDPSQAIFCESVESAHAAHGDHAKISERLAMTRPPFRMDSQCKYAAVARGDASIYLRLPSRKDYQECIWDHAAGSIIVEEAGGRVTDCDGKSLDFTAGRRLVNNRGIIATNGFIHDDLLNAIRSL
ncbi:MAG: 3'(2'),5'-bisphosphate nucleotidase [Kiritimatiellia bacterium]